MRHRSTTRGFTIIEIMIFLVVSSFVFTAAIAQYSSQQHRVEFNQGIRDLQSNLLNLISEVGGSYAPDLSSYTCTANPDNSTLTFTATPSSSNQGCVFLGKAFVFGGDGTGNATCTKDTVMQCSHYAIIPIAGRREFIAADGTGAPVSSLAQTKPVALASCISDAPSPTLYATTLPCGTIPVGPNPFRPDLDTVDNFAQNVSIAAAYIRNADGTFGRPIGGFAFLYDLAGSDALSSDNKSSINLVSLDRAAAPLPFKDNTLIKSYTAISALTGATVVSGQINPADGIALCVLNDFGMKSIITIGASQSKLDVQVEDANGPDMGQCPS